MGKIRENTVKVKEIVNLVTFTEEIINFKIHFLCSDNEINTQVKKDKTRPECLRRVRKLAKSELFARNL